MSTINLTVGETKLLNAVILEMNSIPEVDFDVVAQKVGIKYGKNARQSFKKVWDKLKAGNGTATNRNGAANGDNSDEANDDMEVESPKKPVAKKPAATKKAPAAKKGVSKVTGPKKASEGGPKTNAAPRKTKKQKEEEAAAEAAAAEAADNEDEDMEEEHKDGKSLSSITPIDHASTIEPVEPVVEAFALPASVESVQPTEPVSADGSSETTGAIEVVSISIQMNDEYEAYIREMSLEDWLAWKAENEYTFDIMDII